MGDEDTAVVVLAAWLGRPLSLRLIKKHPFGD
jgi:hypothetical protein